MLTDYGRSARVEAEMQTTTSAAQALVELVADATELLTVELLRLQVPPSVEDRPGAVPRLRAYADEARSRRQSGDSFTEAFLEAAQRHGDLAAALQVVDYHQPFSQAAQRFAVERTDFSLDLLSALAKETPEDQMLVVTSEVTTASGKLHLPLLDFKLAATPENDDVAKRVAERLGGGVLVNSGSSYHLYGRRLVSSNELFTWLLRAQLLSRCVDTRWVTHQLLERKAALRLTRGGSRGAVPMVLGLVQ